MFFFNSSVCISESGILNNYTDHHCHLLPGVDDGVQHIEETLALLQLMEQQGVSNVWFTPHVMEDIPNTPDRLQKRFAEVGYDGGIHLHLGSENMLDTKFSIDNAKTLGLPDNHILVETSYFTAPYNFKKVLREIQSRGIYPMLAHPCRYQYMDLDDYEELKDMGIHFQLNLPAIMGMYGPGVQKKAYWLLDNEFYSITGTDTHRLSQYKRFIDAKVPRKRIRQVEELLGTAK